ncbi:hypothetical protein [Aliidiomarina quisquiliarum]|uniref:hypothetical protein n=1 Tax=Aliidiomarina quisquiliarum TaxID=2938947 RepID=UPI00208FB39D|nr:hypothetical protein [Aliidiomarina quisquiliarum]MCO4322366.1 hypothetical protein [Aliidiomarina quisquiliarum]
MIKKVLYAGLIVFYGFNSTFVSASTVEIDTPNCQISCSESVKLKNNYVIVVRDEQGSIFHIEQLDLANNATHLGSLESVAEVGMVIMSTIPDGSYTNSRTDRYETPTQIIEVTTHFYFNAAGELIDVQVTEVRFTKTPGDTQIEK